MNINDDPGRSAMRWLMALVGMSPISVLRVMRTMSRMSYDITVGTSGNVSEADEDGDQTAYFFGPPQNQFAVIRQRIRCGVVSGHRIRRSPSMCMSLTSRR